MKNTKSTVTLLGITLVVIAIALFAITYSIGPTIVERPVYVNRYVETPIPIVVQPAWWGAFGGGYGKPWKMGSGLPGMKSPPSPPPSPPVQESSPPVQEPPPPVQESPPPAE
jgi:hypothetical protein